jgi:hypothetical protein
MTPEAVFVSNRIVFESNQNRIKSKGFCTTSIENRIESKAIRFDSPGGYLTFRKTTQDWERLPKIEKDYSRLRLITRNEETLLNNERDYSTLREITQH